MNSDFKDLLEAFNENQVEYLIIGGYAVMEHAVPRLTKDLDIWIRSDLTNAEKVFKALVEFGAPLAGLTPHDFTEEGNFYRMGSPPVMVDLLFSLEGVVFQAAWQRRHISESDGIRLNFISKEDLITAKKLAGRPQDLLDVDKLLLPVRSADEFQGHRSNVKPHAQDHTDAIETDEGIDFDF